MTFLSFPFRAGKAAPILACLLALGLLAPLSGPADAAAESAPAGVTTGQKAPDFSLPDATGETRRLSDYAGKIVVLEWTNNECPYVRKQYDSGNMQKTQKAAFDDGVIWLVIHSSAEGEQGHVTAAEALKLKETERSSETARLLDDDGTVGHLYGAKTTPHMFVIDQNGVLVYQGAIDDAPSANPNSVDGAKNYVREALDALEKGETIAIADTKPYGCSVKYSTH